MAGIYAADGSINVTVVDGSSIVEAYASDGSWNVLVSDGSNGPVRDPSGALRVTLTTDPAAQRYASDGSIHVSETKLHSPLWVTAVSGSLSGAPSVAPAAPLMSWASTSADSTPDFSIDLPSGVGDGTDAQAGDVLHIQYSSDAWVTPQEYVSYTLLSGDITADTITESGVTPVADGSYVFRARLERAAGNSSWTADVSVTISTAATPSYTYLGTGLNDGANSVDTYSFNLDIGTAAADRRIVVFLGVGAADTWSARAATVNGVALTELTHVAGPYGNVAAFIGTVPTGSGVVSIDTSVNLGAPGYWVWDIAVWRVDGGVSETPVQVGSVTNATADGAISLTSVTAGDFIIAVADGHDYGAVDFNSSTELPDGVRAPHNEADVYADWTVNAGATPFSVTANGFGPVVAVQLR